MCSIIAGLTALGGLMSYRQQQQQADAQAAMYRAQARAQEQNARNENRRQETIADQYAQDAVRLRERKRLTEGKAAAESGAAGVGMGGSIADMLSAGDEAYRRDQMNLLMNQRNDNYGSREQEQNYRESAAAARNAASNVERQAKWSGIATILGTAASVYGAAQPWNSSTGAAAGKAASPLSVTPTNLAGNTSAIWSNGKGFNFFQTTRPRGGAFHFGW